MSSSSSASESQPLADRLDMSCLVSHFPPGSKRSKNEHRLFLLHLDPLARPTPADETIITSSAGRPAEAYSSLPIEDRAHAAKVLLDGLDEDQDDPEGRGFQDRGARPSRPRG